MNILLTGAAGQLGNELYPLLRQLGTVTAADRAPANSIAPDCVAADLGDSQQMGRLLDRVAPDLVVNAAAYTAVDRAEEEPELSHQVNAEMPAQIARWAQNRGSMLLHYSTDYVFDGKASRPYVESDTPAPLNVYGESKLAGERAIRASGCRSLILRTSWVYSSHGNNFVLSMLKLAKTREHLSIVDDQVGCPTWARNLATVSSQCISRGLVAGLEGCALYHYSDRDGVSWFEFASRIFAHGVRLGLLARAPECSRITTEEYPQAATRPRFSVLDSQALCAAAEVEPSGLDESLLACMKEIVPDD